MIAHAATERATAQDGHMQSNKRTTGTAISACQLTFLPLHIFAVTGVEQWDGRVYLRPVCNLWANCVSCKPPTL